MSSEERTDQIPREDSTPSKEPDSSDLCAVVSEAENAATSVASGEPLSGESSGNEPLGDEPIELHEDWRADGESEPWSPPAIVPDETDNAGSPHGADSDAGNADASTTDVANGTANGTANGSGGNPPPPVVPASPDGNEEQEPEEDATAPMSLTEHLGELRTRLVRVLLGAAVGFLLCYGVSEQLFNWLAMPLAAVMPADTKLIYTSVPEGFFVYLKVAFVGGVFVASPYIFYQVWAFIAPGLYKEERQMMLPLAVCSALFFLLGASFCYFLVFPYAFTFFMSYSTGMIVAMPAIDEYLGFSLKMLLAFGLIFEMPLFAFFLARMGIVTAAWMRKVRRYAVLVVFVVAAILTPPDVFSQMLMAVPMLLLYEVSIWVAAAVGRKKAEKKAHDADDAAAEKGGA